MQTATRRLVLKRQKPIYVDRPVPTAVSANGQVITVYQKIQAIYAFAQDPDAPKAPPELDDEGRALCALAFARITSGVPIHRVTFTACVMLLDMHIPGWRDDDDALWLPALVLRRSDSRVQHWRARVLTRDNFTCQECETEELLHVHHIEAWDDAPWLRDIDENGVTLCAACHRRVHNGH